MLNVDPKASCRMLTQFLRFSCLFGVFILRTFHVSLRANMFRFEKNMFRSTGLRFESDELANN